LSALEWACASVTALAAVPAVVFGVQVMAAIWPRTRPEMTVDPGHEARLPRRRLAVIVPAHNERAGIVRTIAALRPQLREGDRLVVVADNCTDDTAAVAAEAGAIVSERNDAGRRGKGYALHHGVRFLAADPPDIVVVIDADCVTHPGSLDALAETVAEHGRPVQSLNLMQAGDKAGLRWRAAEFTWRIKNQVRPLGWSRLGAPCQLMGTGMALPWPMMESASLASGNLAEDMQLGVDLALKGSTPRFEPRALVTSGFPDTDEAAAAQRKRWEHGHLATLLSAGPKLFREGLLRRRWGVLGFALDLTVPPLTLLIALHLALFGFNLIAWWSFDWKAPVIISACALSFLVGGTAIAWRGFGRELLSLGELLGMPLLLIRKLSIYASFMRRRDAHWVRAKRDNE